MRAARREAGFTINSTRSIRRGENFIAVAALKSKNLAESRDQVGRIMLGAGIEPAWEFIPRDFKSLASTGFATRAAGVCVAVRNDTRVLEERSAGCGKDK